MQIFSAQIWQTQTKKLPLPILSSRFFVVSRQFYGNSAITPRESIGKRHQQNQRQTGSGDIWMLQHPPYE